MRNSIYGIRALKIRIDMVGYHDEIEMQSIHIIHDSF